jgi:putative addiction module killer protein
MIEVRQTEVFTAWFAGLRDQQARARIRVRIDRLSLGNPGDVKPVGSGVSEMRINYGPGYRLYFVSRGTTVVILVMRWRQAKPRSRHRTSDRTGAEGLGYVSQNDPLGYS